MKKILLFFIVCLFGVEAFSQISDSIGQPKVKPLPDWTLYVPGATHFFEKRYIAGALFTSIEIGGITTGIIFDKKLKENSDSPLYNYPLFIGLKAYEVDKCDFFRNRLAMIKERYPDFKYDDMNFGQLMAASFKPKNVFSKLTLGVVALAVAELWLESKYSRFNISKVDQFYFLDHYMDRDPALAVYGASSMALSMGAGISEEYMFRNMLMPILDYRHGQRKGLVISSAVFGGIHAFNYLFVDNPDPLVILYHVSFASLMGYVFGKNVQLNNYKIGKAVAAHTWYDFSLMLGSFLVNPEENIFGVNLKLNIN